MAAADVGIVYAATNLDRYVEEAFLSADSVKRVAPTLPITLFTDRPNHPLCKLGRFDRIEAAPVVTGFGHAWAEGQLARIESLLRTPYARTLHLDTDTRVYTDKLPTLFAMLEAADVGMVEEAADVSVSRSRTDRRMFNAGFILFRSGVDTQQWLEQWRARVRRNFAWALATPLPDVPEIAHVASEDARRDLLRMDQVALMDILSPDRNAFGLVVQSLDAAWNYRGSRLQYRAQRDVKIAHSDSFKHTTLGDLLALAFEADQNGQGEGRAIYDYVASRHASARAPGKKRFVFWRADPAPEEWSTSLLRDADLHLSHGQIDHAMKLFDRVAATDRALGYALAGQARIALLLAKFDAAIVVAEQARALMPKSAYVAAMYGAALLAGRRIDEAIELLREAAERGSAAGAVHLGRAYFESGRFAESAEAYRRALDIDPRHEVAANNILHALAGSGAYTEIVTRTDQVHAAKKWSVPALAFRATALAELGRDAEERALVDLEQLVVVSHPASPEEWGTPVAFLTDLRDAILRAPSLERDPAAHATRGGWHSGDLSRAEEPSLRALNQMILTAAAERVAAAKGGHHVFSAAAPRTYDMHAWAVIMQRGGHQTAHMHGRAWLSGVYYVEVPEAVRADDPTRAGWLRFGRAEERWHRSDTRTVERYVCPRSGLLVTFPSFFWHQTVPLTTDSRRISYAFDILPR